MHVALAQADRLLPAEARCSFRRYFAASRSGYAAASSRRRRAASEKLRTGQPSRQDAGGTRTLTLSGDFASRIDFAAFSEASSDIGKHRRAYLMSFYTA